MQSTRKPSSFFKDIANLSFDKTDVLSHLTSSYPLSLVRKSDDTHLTSSTWIYKSLTNKSPERAELETVAGECYRLILGADRAPKYRTVMQNGESINAVISKYIPFESMNSSFDIEDISQVRNIASLMAAAYFLEEEDLQSDNVSKNGKIKIDHGMSLWSLVSLLDQSDYPHPNTNDFLASYLLRFPLENTSYENLIHPDMLEKLATHPHFIEEKFKTFLKIILIPINSFSIILNHSLSNPQRQKQAFYFLEERQNALFFTLVKMPEFILYLTSHGKVIKEISEELSEFNQLFKKEKDQHRQVSIEAAQARFFQIISCTKVSKPRKKTRTKNKPERKAKFAC